MAVGEHYQAWSEEVQEKIVSLFSHRLQSTAELRAKLKDANSLLSDWLKIGNNMAERRAIRDRARTFLASMEGRGGEGANRKHCRTQPERAEERRVGKEWDRKCGSRGWPDH